MQAEDHASLMELWRASEGVILRESDTPDAMARFLARNLDTSWVALHDNAMVGSIMAGQDGWRGYLYHVAVHPDWRRQGIGTQLVEKAVAAIQSRGIPRIHCLVKHDNADAQAFWLKHGFTRRDDVVDFAL
ncbi:GCN5 family acetyltransferase [Novimethylophilus kurashikiensis]|uniref:GCN5 family acetyltransferase n=2 Tax=Novimethylophilus kurashikiensis TaxID=1825523 RepID=A0A2R5F6C1_9PROT|nr:GCN5 family acetyltransferase [Novimethylophilus kurashikiensis]